MPRTEKTRRTSKTFQIPAHRLTTVFVLVCGLVFMGSSILADFSAPDALSPEPSFVAENESYLPELSQEKDYSRFTHGNQFHSRLPCLLCHRRDDNSARMRFPGKPDHLPCAGCHSLQFSDTASPICTICHTNPQTGAVKAFPPLRSFGVRFNHSRHLRVSCNVCHKTRGPGAALSIPSGRSAHVTCFQCHTANSSHSMSSCNLCHQPGRFVRVSETARAFQVGFSHNAHGGSKNLTCNSCHTVRAGTARGRQVSAPLASMHFASTKAQSCATCHNGKRAFGTEDFANCRRCHKGQTFKF